MDIMSNRIRRDVPSKLKSAGPELNQSIRRWGATLAVFLAGVPATAAAQVEGEANPLTEFIMAVSGELIIPVMIGCLVLGSVFWLASSAVRNPQTASDLKSARNASYMAVLCVPLALAFFDYIAPLLPFGVGDQIDFTGLF